MDYSQTRKYIGDLSQIAGIRHAELKSGKGKGVETFDVRTGGGLEYTVLKDRCLDIAWASYRGYSLTHFSNTGVVAPSFFDPRGTNYLKSFYVGLLSTCGLTYVGSPNVDEGIELGLHGVIGNTPAEECGFETREMENTSLFEIRGRVRESTFFGENLTLDRSIQSEFGKNVIRISDRVRNRGFVKQPLQMIYHINYGYPLLSEKAEIRMPAKAVRPRTEEAARGIDTHLLVEKPQSGYVEQCFYIDFRTDRDGGTMVALFNEDLGFGVYQKFRVDQLPRFIQWKQMGEGYYVMGLEPANCYPDGRSKERNEGTLEFIASGETRNFDLEIGILEDRAAWADACRIIDSYR